MLAVLAAVSLPHVSVAGSHPDGHEPSHHSDLAGLSKDDCGMAATTHDETGGCAGSSAHCFSLFSGAEEPLLRSSALLAASFSDEPAVFSGACRNGETPPPRA